jgi:LuxR family transcriptional regulator, maltose regulon positive regulatory protein
VHEAEAAVSDAPIAVPSVTLDSLVASGGLNVPLVAGRHPGPMASSIWEIQALVLEAIARDAVGDVGAAEHALDRALDLAEPDGLLFPFLFDPAPALLERHPQVLAAHALLVGQIRRLLERAESSSAASGSELPPDELSDAETRVLRYLPTHMTAAEIANELYVSANTVKTHMRHVYAKLGVHRRSEAIERARALGLLATRAQRRQRSQAPESSPRRPAEGSFGGIVGSRALRALGATAAA